MSTGNTEPVQPDPLRDAQEVQQDIYRTVFPDPGALKDMASLVSLEGGEETSGQPMVHGAYEGMATSYTVKKIKEKAAKGIADIENRTSSAQDNLPDTLAYYLLSGGDGSYLEGTSHPVLRARIIKDLSSLETAFKQAIESGQTSGHVRVETTSGTLLVEVNNLQRSYDRVGAYLRRNGGNKNVVSDRKVSVIDDKAARAELRAVPLDTLLEHRITLERKSRDYSDGSYVDAVGELRDLNRTIGVARAKVLFEGSDEAVNSVTPDSLRAQFGDLSSDEMAAMINGVNIYLNESRKY